MSTVILVLLGIILVLLRITTEFPYILYEDAEEGVFTMTEKKYTKVNEDALPIIQANLKRLAKLRGLTQVEISDLTKIPATTVNGYFNGRSMPIVGNTEKLAKVFNVPKESVDPRFSPDVFKEYNIEEANKKLSHKENEFFNQLIEKTLSLDEADREKLFENVRFAVKFFDKED